MKIAIAIILLFVSVASADETVYDVVKRKAERVVKVSNQYSRASIIPDSEIWNFGNGYVEYRLRYKFHSNDRKVEVISAAIWEIDEDRWRYELMWYEVNPDSDIKLRIEPTQPKD